MGKIEGFWFEKGHITYSVYLFPQFHHCSGAGQDFLVLTLKLYLSWKNVSKGRSFDFLP